MKFNSLEYFALVDIKQSPGVARKIEGTVEAAQKMGMTATTCIMPKNVKGVAILFRRLFFTESSVVVIRFSDLIFPIVFFVMIWLRIRRKKIVVDVPTPRSKGLIEIGIVLSNPVKRNLRKFISYASASWILLPASLIIQYADEGQYFSFGLSRKTIKIGNGINIKDDTPIANSQWPNPTINLIAVAKLSNWHGYDRLLYALAELEKKQSISRFSLKIIGDGCALGDLKKITRDLQIKSVEFTGQLTGKNLDDAFLGAHVGVASLGLYRIGLNEASVLKTREYMARGLPVIAAGDDPDFGRDCRFRVSVENCNETESLVTALEELPQLLSELNAGAIRRYALDHLTLEAKLKMILQKI